MEQPTDTSDAQASTLEHPEEDVEAPAAARVEDVFRTLGKTVRAHQLYEGTSPVYDKFVDQLRIAFLALWEEVPTLTVDIREGRIDFDGRAVYESSQRTDNLAFLFYRDGIRQVMIRPGFERTELNVFLDLLARVHRVRDEEDDLITLLWEQDFAHFEYRHVDVGVDGAEVPERSGGSPGAIDVAALRAEPQQAWRDTASPPAQTYDPGVVDLPVTFQDTLHFLEESELRFLQEDLRRELKRDLMRDVLNGLFDRLHDGAEERQKRIVQILTDLLPGLISHGRIADATLILRELADRAGAAPPLAKPVLSEIKKLFEQLALPETVRELVRTVTDAPDAVTPGEFAQLLTFFPPSALAPLILAAEGAERQEVRRAISEVIERMASDDPQQVVELLGSEDPLLAAGSARLVGRLGVRGAAPDLARMLEHGEASVRLAAVQALQELRASSAAGALQNVLSDADREVRIAAVRALGALRYTPARPRLESLLATRAVREADVTERIAFFEAYGSVAGAEGVEMLNRMLNGRNWLGRREPAEIRACAALALGRIDHPAARDALQAASGSEEPVVRMAVSRGLRRESQ